MYQSEHHYQPIREDFVGTPKVNVVTEMVEPDYPASERLKRYIESVLVISVLLFFIFIYLVIMYNLTGVIKPEEGTWKNLFNIRFLSDLCEPDQIFDLNTNWAFIPSIGQTVITMIFNSYFRGCAKWLTDRENHKYQEDYDSSLIIKRFLFEFYDCFLPLIYLGWWERDFKILRETVVMLYVVDEIRRVATESLIPYLTQGSASIKKKVSGMSLSNKQSEIMTRLKAGPVDDSDIQ